jgi:DNA-binding NtrC family response regulator
VVVVDDDADLLSLIERVLSAYRVSTAHDADEALLILSGEDRVDLLITDFLMPKMTGEGLVHEARKRRPNLRVLVITGHANVVAAAEATWWRSEAHLTKPFGMDALLRAVQGMIGTSDTRSTP